MTVPQPAAAAARQVALVAGREVRTRLRSRAFLAGSAVMLAVVAAIVLAPVLLAGAGPGAGAAPRLAAPVTADAGGAEVRVALTLGLSAFLFFQLVVAGLMVAVGVVEEKSSRVVEVLLALVPPRRLLHGKVLGIGLLGLGQTAAVLAVGSVGLAAAAAALAAGPAALLLAGALLWFVLGYLFFAYAFAGAASLVSRQEDVNSTTLPVTVLAMAAYLPAVAAGTDPGAAWVVWLSHVPPFSAQLMPVRLAAGDLSAAELLGPLALMLAALAGLARLAARVYERSVLRTGQRVRLAELRR